MDKKMTFAIATVVVLVAASLGVALFFFSTDKNSAAVETGRLVIYGNANNDDYLDEKDVIFIEEILNKDKEWDSVKYPFADTDTNGMITQNDVDLLKKFLKKESAEMFYFDCAGTIQSIHYPITGNLAVVYNYGLDATIVLGCYDRVVAVSDNVIKMPTNTETKYPGVKSMVNIRNPSVDPEDLMQAGIDHNIKAIFGIGEASLITVQNKLKEANSDIDVITICTSGYKGQSCDYIGSIVTLGVMFGCEQNAYKYIGFVDKILNHLDEKLKNAPEYTMVIPYNPTNAVDVHVDTAGSSKAIGGDAYTLGRLPLKDLFAGKRAGWYYIVNIEDIMVMDPDILMISTWATMSDSMTRQEVQDAFEAISGYFNMCNAYKNGKVFCAAFESLGTYPGVADLILLASFIWPDLVDEGYGWKVLQEYYDTFTMLKVDVKKVGGFAPMKL